MRSLLLLALLGGALGTAQAAPPAYHPPRHFYTPSHQPYRRPPVRLTFGVNTAYYNGDLTNRFSDNTFHPGFSLGLTHALSPHLTFGADVAYIRLQAKDYYPSRGLRFSSTDGLLTSFVRYNLFADKSMYLGPNYKPTTAQLFLQAGVGALLNNPRATVTTSLPPYGTVALPPEVRGGYPTLAGVLPVGAGVTLNASRSLCFTLEALYYFTTTDLLDDVSVRVNSNALDSFATLNFKVEYAFARKKGRPLVHFN